jgi:RNA polymerase sigma-70 factor, ECF subfamily
LNSKPKVQPGEVSDRSLVQQLQEGCPEAARQLYERYAQRLRALAWARTPLKLARRLEADDIVQSVFRIFLQRAWNGHYEVPSGEDLWGLLLVITLNKIRSLNDYHLAAKRDARQTTSMTDDSGFAQASMQRDNSERLFLNLCIQEAMDTLPQEFKSVVELRLAGHEVAEIAQVMGRSKRTVERSLQEAIRRLRVVLETG